MLSRLANDRPPLCLHYKGSDVNDDGTTGFRPLPCTCRTRLRGTVLMRSSFASLSALSLSTAMMSPKLSSLLFSVFARCAFHLAAALEKLCSPGIEKQQIRLHKSARKRQVLCLSVCLCVSVKKRKIIMYMRMYMYIYIYIFRSVASDPKNQAHTILTRFL